MEKYYDIATKKGGKVLYDRSSVGELSVGDKFKVQSLKDEFEVLFFFKDSLFDYYPMVFGLCCENGEAVLITSRGLATITETKRKRRTE